MYGKRRKNGFKAELRTLLRRIRLHPAQSVTTYSLVSTEELKRDLYIDSEVCREGAHPLWPLRQQGLDPIKLAYK